MENDTWQQIGAVTQRMLSKLAPVTYVVPIDGDLAVDLERCAMREGRKAELIIARAIQAYIKDAA